MTEFTLTNKEIDNTDEVLVKFALTMSLAWLRVYEGYKPVATVSKHGEFSCRVRFETECEGLIVRAPIELIFIEKWVPGFGRDVRLSQVWKNGELVSVK